MILYHFHPYIEDKAVRGHDLHSLMLNENSQYWQALLECRTDIEIPSEEFKELFFGMVRRDPLKRLSLNEIKTSKWYKGQKLRQDEIRSVLCHYLKK